MVWAKVHLKGKGNNNEREGEMEWMVMEMDVVSSVTLMTFGSEAFFFFFFLFASFLLFDKTIKSIFLNPIHPKELLFTFSH